MNPINYSLNEVLKKLEKWKRSCEIEEETNQNYTNKYVNKNAEDNENVEDMEIEKLNKHICVLTSDLNKDKSYKCILQLMKLLNRECDEKEDILRDFLSKAFIIMGEKPQLCGLENSLIGCLKSDSDTDSNTKSLSNDITEKGPSVIKALDLFMPVIRGNNYIAATKLIYLIKQTMEKL